MSEKKIKTCRTLFDLVIRKRATVLEKLNKYGTEWMSPEVYHDWCRASLVYALLDDLIDNDDEQCFDYTLFFMLGCRLIDLLSSVNFELNKFKEEN